MKTFEQWLREAAPNPFPASMVQTQQAGQTQQTGQTQQAQQTQQIGQQEMPISRGLEYQFIAKTKISSNDPEALSAAFWEIIKTARAYGEQSPALTTQFMDRMIAGFKDLGDHNFNKYLNDANNLIKQGRWPTQPPSVSNYDAGWASNYDDGGEDLLSQLQSGLQNIDSLTGFSSQAQKSAFDNQ